MSLKLTALLTRARQFSQLGQLEAAEKLYGQILRLDSSIAAAHFELGLVLLKQNRVDAAISPIQQAVAIEPERPEYHNILGIAFSSSGDHATGARCFKKALELDPGNVAVHNNLGNNYREQGLSEQAMECYRKAISLNPHYVDAYINLGELLRKTGEPGASETIYRKAMAIQPDRVDIQFNLGLTLHHARKYREAAEVFGKIAAEQPDYPGIHNDLGLALVRIGKFEEGIAHYRKAIEKNPDFAMAYNNLGNALLAQSDPAGAVTCFRKALSLNPGHARAHSNLLLSMNYMADVSQEDMYREAQQFDRQHAGRHTEGEPVFPASKDRDRVLRIGYVSPDFRSHSVAHFIRKLFGEHDRDQVEVYCYANVLVRDAVTDELEAQTDSWCSITGMTSDEAADHIRKDQVDILVDLAGHTADNRLLLFARRPAPVQVNWLGYPNTTGLRCMDYRLTDEIADPPGEADRLHVEQLVRLPHGFLCFQTDSPVPPVSSPPCTNQGHITFGSFNSLQKITAEVITAWSEILHHVPGSRLMLKSSALADETTRIRCATQFAAQGIDRDRIELHGLIPARDDHLAMYSQIDIGLDTFPYNGTTTTCEALWMGVPVVTLRGNRHAGRVGASILHHVGIPELIADSVDAYIEQATTLAEHTEELANLRRRLRPQMRASALMNTAQFARSLEKAYRTMWQVWCDGCHPAPPTQRH